MTGRTFTPKRRGAFSPRKDRGTTLSSRGQFHVNCISDEEKAAQAKIAEHLTYLRRMVAEGVISSELALNAKIVWIVAGITTGDRLPVPAAAAFPGGPIEYHWAVGPHQLSAEIPAEGPCLWTYRNKVTGELWGRETPTDDELPPRLVDYLTRIAASNR
jgi:hypothetical protein